MALSPATFYDDNGVVRLQGQLDGGGSAQPFPAEWAVEVENDRVLRYEVGVTGGVFQLQPGLNGNAGVVQSVLDSADGAQVALQLETSGALGTATLALFNNSDPDGATAVVDARGYVNFFTVAGNKAIEAWDAAGTVLRFALLPAGQVMIGVLAAPADGDLAAGQLALWFDDTNGAAKLMVKAKTADGTVVAAAIALA